MKIMSWNVNGLAACKRKGFLRVLAHSRADIFCCQEIKSRCPLSTPGYFQFWNPAQRPGYSGTLTLSRREPLSVHYGMGIREFDEEGRLIVLEYGGFYVVNVYVPNSQSGLARLDYRTAWDEALLSFLKGLDKPVVLCGDFNVARDFIDVYPENIRNTPELPGFQSQEREGMERLLSLGLTDVFRAWYPQVERAYTWWSARLNKRQENRGWRLDYFLVSDALLSSVRGITHHTDILGSDHCPISLILQPAAPRKELSDEDLAAMWRGLNWEALEDQLLELQQSLARVTFAGHWNHVKQLQKELVRSLAAKALAVRHVVQRDSEPGVDHVRWTTDAEKMRAALSLTSKGYHAKPYRRIVVMDGGKERRINVPTAYDKAMQALYAFSLDPVAESVADKKSFAFRKGRSAFDAHACICRTLENADAPDWIVCADVRACYDTLSQDWLMANIPMDKKVLWEFLKAGAAFGGELFPTEVGISQGATLSPILGNMALDGLQSYLYERLYPNGNIDYAAGDMTRFADDLIIAARSRAQADYILTLLEEFLAVRGLKLNWNKTYISTTYLGFEFLSRWYQMRDGVLTVHPSEGAVKKFEANMEAFILGHRGSQRTLIEQLNRKLSGWANYHRVTDAYDVFRRIDSSVQALLIRKMRRLYPKRKWKTIQETYWIAGQNGRHIFALRDNKAVRVVQLSELEISEHRPIRLSFHPYLDQDYYVWLQNRRDTQKVSGSKRRGIWRRQDGRCHYCGRPMLPDQEIELVEIVQGHGRTASNMAYIHRRCAYDTLSEEQPAQGAEFDFFSTLEGVTELTRGLEDPYWDLREFFRLCRKPSVTLTLLEIEKIIGFELDWEARFYPAFWFDEAPALEGRQWAREFPFHVMFPSQQSSEYVISDAWRSQGYRIQRLDLHRERVVFHREVYGTVGLTIPPALLQTRIPENAAYEATTFFAYLIKKYGL